MKGTAFKRICLFFCFCLLSVSLLATSASAQGEAEALLSELREILPPSLRTENTEQLLSRVGVRGIFEEILAALSGEGGAFASFLLLCLGSAVLIAAAHAVADGSAASLLEGLAAAMMGIVIFEPLGACAEATVRQLNESAAFFGAASPIMHGITLAAGGVQSAAAAAMGAQITLYVIELFFCRLVVPVASVLMALDLISTLGEEGAALSSLSGSIRRIFLWMLGLGTTLLSAALSLQTILSAGADSAAMRTAKYTATGLLPLVGGAVSASLSTLATGLSFVKTTAGVSVVAALLLLTVPMLIRLLLYRLCLDISSGFSEFLGIRGAARMFSAFKSGMDALIAVFALCSVLFLLQSVLFLYAGVAIL